MPGTTCIINIGGQNVTTFVMPYLIQLTVTDKAGGTTDTCELELDDKDGQLFLPKTGDDVSVLLGNAGGVSQVFVGVVDEIRSTGSTDGMKLHVSAKSADTKGKAKEPKQKHWDKKKLSEVMTEAGQAAGINEVQVAPALASIERDYWAMQNESFFHFGSRLAREVGGTFKVAGKKAIIAEKNGGASASGAALPSFTALRPGNLISWDISPSLGRTKYKETKVRHYDTKTASWKEETEQTAIEDAEATFVDRHVAADQDEAKNRAKNHKKQSEREAGGGSISVNGTTVPQPEGNCILSGARPGIDGTYRIETVTQDFSAGSGWITRLELKQPQDAAGKDARKSKKKA